MAKRIVSGIFILTALGALGVILAGAMTSGEQLIVRFLTAVTVAALALYVISDLRLQNEQEEAPTESDRKTPDRAAAGARASEAVVKGPHRGQRFGRRRRDASSVQPAPNFEAIEPVTARVRTAPAADPTESVTGSRLVPPAPEQAERVMPPHPTTGRPLEERLDHAAAVAAPSESISSNAADGARQAPDTAGLAYALDNAAEGEVENGAGGRHAVEPRFVTPPDERPPTTSLGSVIATTSFTYSGRLHSSGFEWPPKPPESDDPDDGADEGDPLAKVGALDAPTAELPALSEPTADWGHDNRMAMSDPTVDLFAIDTADLLDAESDAATISMFRELPDDSTAARPLIRRIEAAQYATPPRTDHLDLREDAVTTGEFDRPVPAVRPSRVTSSDKLTAAIRSGESQVINSLINQGMLTTSGPITDRDVRTMVYVAFTSNELRKLILAGGTPDGVRAGDLELGEVELFDESRFAPPPKLLYSGPQEQPDAILDLVALENESAEPGSSDPGLEHDHDERDDVDADLVPTLPTPKHLYRVSDSDRVEHEPGFR